MIRLGLADDEPLFTMGLATLLGAQPDMEIIWRAADGKHALARNAVDPADVLLLDVRMPGLSGPAATGELMARGVAGRVVILTTSDTDDAVVRVIEAGAVGYLLKYSASEELHAGLRRVMAGESALSPGALAELLRYVRSQPTAPTMAAYDARSQERQHAVAQARQAAAGLSRRELEIIAVAAEGLTTEEIANRLYISVSTVKAHLRSAQERVGARNRVHLAVLAERAGLLG